VARKKSQTLTEAELPIMEVLWEKGAATVGDVAEALSKDRVVAYNTVLTLMRILERKGYVRHTKDGRAFVYQPLMDRGEVSRTAVRQLLNRFFNDSPELLMLNLLQNETIDQREVERLRGLIDGE
jgi:predicted transcriptional regulator